MSGEWDELPEEAWRDWPEEEWIAHYLPQYVARQPNEPPEYHRAALRARLLGYRERKAQDDADAALAEKAGTTIAAIREARAEKLEAERRERAERERERALRAVGIPAGREPADKPAERPAVTRRGPGRPKWDRDLFLARLEEAQAATSPPRTPGRMAGNFRRLDGTLGMEPDSLARLMRRHLPGG